MESMGCVEISMEVVFLEISLEEDVWEEEGKFLNTSVCVLAPNL